jgi:murein DD-endopeptidase MepM/ murein hydrolase activator NlpD
MTTAKKSIVFCTALSFVALFSVLSVFVFNRSNSPDPSPQTVAATDPAAEAPAADAEGGRDKSPTLVEGELRSGDTLSRSLTRYNIEPGVRQQILENLAGCLDFKKLRPKDKYRVFLDDQGQLLRYEYENGPLDSYTITRTAGTFVARRDEVNIAIKTCMVEDAISTSLFDAFFDNELQAPLVYAFADIFSSRIDFNTETQKDDTFRIVFEKYFKDDQFVGYGNILYARYRQLDGKVHEGYFYQADAASSGSYFDAQGSELGTSFIKSPVPLGRVTSKFSFSRLHPISGIMRPHLGVDLAAPSGTPIMATSDGKVSYIGYNGGFGRQIVLSHAGGYQTFYGHLSRFSKGLKNGSTVKQKQIIGYVGSSGMSTGPHLDYRVQQLGKFYDPFAIEFRPKSVLRGEKLARFQSNITSLASLLESAPDPEVLYVRYMVLKPDEQLTML